MILKGQDHRSKQMAPSGSLTLKTYISRCQNRPPKCLRLKVMVKDLFLHNAGQRNTFAYVSRSNRSGCFFDLLKGPHPSYSVLKFGDNLSSRNRDVAQSVILYSCDLERSRSSVRSIIFCTAVLTLPMSICVCSRYYYFIERSRPKLSCVKIWQLFAH